MWAVTVVATLGVGIAATTTMFSVVHAALIRPVPFDEPERLVMLNVADSGRVVNFRAGLNGQ